MKLNLTKEQIEKNNKIIEAVKEKEKNIEISYMKILDWKRENKIDLPLIETIVEFCEYFDLDVTNVGKKLKQDPTFVQAFKADLIKHKYHYYISEEDRYSITDWI